MKRKLQVSFRPKRPTCPDLVGKIPTLSEGICFFVQFLTTAESLFPIVSLAVDAGHDKAGRLSSILIEEGHCFP